MRLSIAYASAKVCRLAIESIDSLDYSVSGNPDGRENQGWQKSWTTGTGSAASPPFETYGLDWGSVTRGTESASEETADLSTSLRSGRDDNFVLRIEFSVSRKAP